MEKVDILLATYNGEKYLEAQLDSILEQTYNNFRLIISDDCSNDNTKKILERYEKKDNRNQVTGNIHRIPGKFENFMPVLDCYQIIFPINATGEERFLLLCSVFLIEYQIFRNKFGSLDCCPCGYSSYQNESCCQNCLRFSGGRFFSGIFRI